MGGSVGFAPDILDDFSRFIVACKLCTTKRAGDVTDTLELYDAVARRLGAASFRSESDLHPALPMTCCFDRS